MKLIFDDKTCLLVTGHVDRNEDGVFLFLGTAAPNLTGPLVRSDLRTSACEFNKDKQSTPPGHMIAQQGQSPSRVHCVLSGS